MRFSAIAMLLGAVASQELFLQQDHRVLYEDESSSAADTTAAAAPAAEPAAAPAAAPAPATAPATAPSAAAPAAAEGAWMSNMKSRYSSFKDSIFKREERAEGELSDEVKAKIAARKEKF